MSNSKLRGLPDSLPACWDIRTIDGLAEHVGSGITPRGGRDVYEEQGVMFIRSQNVHFDGLHLDDVAYISSVINDSMSRSEVFENDVLLNITGASIGRCCRLPSGLGKANVNQHVCAIRLTDSSRADSLYLSHYLASHLGRRQVALFNAGGNRDGLNYQQVRAFQVIWPPAKERFRIAEILDAVDDQIRATEQVFAKLEKARKGLVDDLLTRGIGSNARVRSRDDVPTDWTLSHVSEVVEDLVDGPFGSNLKTAHYRDRGVRVVRLQNIEAAGFNDLDQVFISAQHAAALSRHSVRSGDVLVASLGDDRRPYGRACLYPSNLAPGVVKADCFRVRVDLSQVLPEIVVALLNSDYCRRQLRLRGQGVTRDRINLSVLRAISLPIPPLDEQRRIAATLRNHDEWLRTEQLAESKLQVLKQGLMADLFTGRARVPAEVLS